MISTGGRDRLATVTLKINSFDFDAIDFQSSNAQCEFLDKKTINPKSSSLFNTP